MADWTDGPEYAPEQRPDAFVEPDALPLAQAAPAGSEQQGPPPEGRPEFGQPGEAIPLDRLESQKPQQRDPSEAFAVVTTPLAATTPLPDRAQPSQPLQLSSVPQASAWGSVHAAQAAPRAHDPRAPQQPMALPDLPPVQLPPAPGAQGHPQVNPGTFTDPDAGRWYSGYAHPQPRSRPQPITITTLWENVTPGLLLSLFVGGWASGLSPLCLVAAALFARRVRYRRSTVTRAIVAGTLASLVIAVLSTMSEFGINVHQISTTLGFVWEQWTVWAPLACWVLLVAVLLIVSGAMRRGEPQEGP